ncbi:DUF1232 domain-containing protein [Hymenobacter sp. 15J16-1T3B]|uniref:YkvA family protein n=1 Tax=Hymenobacter sp. 15J16-1T3B TaxID=2886941 RepID=UPI001D12ED4D|nr:DUF1232 domain-containing protein [Hymenobacter sp. 15J16-1T3B]MCC3160295.1 DUF1232 domain-containing protein [Hymenobacter sp. 15J16-1T3B]
MATLTERGLQISKNALFNVFTSRAGKLLGKPFKAVLVLNEVADKLASEESKDNKFKQLFDAALTVVRLVRAYVNGSYREVQTSTIVSGLGVLLYVLSPIDLVPDFIPVLGFLDDLSLVSWFIGKFQDEIRRFREWETSSAAADAPTTALAPTASASSAANAVAIAEMGHS